MDLPAFLSTLGQVFCKNLWLVLEDLHHFSSLRSYSHDLLVLRALMLVKYAGTLLFFHQLGMPI